MDNQIENVRKAKVARLVRLIRLWVGIPTLLATIFFGLIASDYYESEAKFTIQSTDNSGAGNLDTLLGSLTDIGTDKDALTVRDYILSRDVLARLEKEHQFNSHFQHSGADWFTRLSKTSSFEEAYDYYLDKVEVNYDPLSGVSTLSVKALNAEQAAIFSRAILGYSEELVNELSDRAELDQLNFAKKEVAEGEKRLAKARQVILEQQRVGEEINPTEAAAAIFAIRNALEAELAVARAEMTALTSYMRPEAPQVVALKHKVESMASQIQQENKRLVNTDDEGLSHAIARFEPLVLEKEFAQAAYELTLATLEVTRTEAAKKHRYLATIVQPSTPDEATHPERLMGILSVFILSLTALGIGSLWIAAVREHARI